MCRVRTSNKTIQGVEMNNLFYFKSLLHKNSTISLICVNILSELSTCVTKISLIKK